MQRTTDVRLHAYRVARSDESGRQSEVLIVPRLFSRDGQRLILSERDTP